MRSQTQAFQGELLQIGASASSAYTLRFTYALMEGLIDVRHVFHLLCRDREQLIQRLRNRALHDNRLDDANDAVIRQRLETYESETTRVLKFYREKLTTIDATPAPVRVINEITSAILNLAAPSARNDAIEGTVKKRSANLATS